MPGLRRAGPADPRPDPASLAAPALLSVPRLHRRSAAAGGVYAARKDGPGGGAMVAARVRVLAGDGGVRDRPVPGDAGGACGTTGRGLRRPHPADAAAPH